MKQIKKICLLTNYNLYESKRRFTAGFKEALDRKGIETAVFDWQKKDPGENFLESIRSFQPDLILSFNSFAPASSGKQIWELLDIPTLFCIVDPCLYYANLQPHPNLLLSSVDRYDTEILKQNGYSKVFFMPHAVDAVKGEARDEKVIDILLTGSCYDYESLKEDWEAKLPAAVHRVLENASERVLGPGCVPLLQALVDAWNDSGLDGAAIDFYGLFYYLDYYTRGLDRINLIKSFKNVPVHVFGDLAKDHPSARKGWGYYLQDMPNVTIYSPLRYEAALKMQNKAKFCLNSMPFFKNGSHERILTSLSAGAVPITSESLWTKEEFDDGEDLLIYQPGSYEGLEEKVLRLLADENRRKEIAFIGRNKVQSLHTWDNRAELLLLEFGK